MKPTKPVAFIMLGFPGSGKSYVSEWLAFYMGATHLRADDMRLAMFGEEQLEHHKNWKYQRQVHGAMHYASEQVLKSGYSVIYDANHNSLKSRQPIARLARETDALPILVWVKAPIELAKQRVLDREAAGGHKVFEIDFVERMANNLEEPTSNELVIELDGTAPETDQKAAFDRQFAKIIADQVQ